MQYHSTQALQTAKDDCSYWVKNPVVFRASSSKVTGHGQSDFVYENSFHLITRAGFVSESWNFIGWLHLLGSVDQNDLEYQKGFCSITLVFWPRVFKLHDLVKKKALFSTGQ